MMMISKPPRRPPRPAPQVQGLLKSAQRPDIEVEIVFPVNPHAITTKSQKTAGAPARLPGDLAVLPGPALGEGCSLEGGCASCPYMRMNTLSELCAVCEKVGTPGGEALLEPYKPKPYVARMASGATVARAGCVPILHMRDFQQTKKLSGQLVHDIESRTGARK